MLYRIKIVSKSVRIESVEAENWIEAQQKARDLPIRGTVDKQITLEHHQPDVNTSLELILASVPIGNYVTRMDVVNMVATRSQASRDDVYDIVSDYFGKNEGESWEAVNKNGIIAYKKIA